jgi:hypothetical protein
LNQKIAVKGREITRQRYEAEVFSTIQEYGCTGFAAPQGQGAHWNVEDVKTAVARMGSAQVASAAEVAAPVADCADDQNQVSPANPASAPLPAFFSKSEIASAFDGIWKKSWEWNKYLGDTIPKWLQKALARPASRGDKDGRQWNPVDLAEALLMKKRAREDELNRAFWKPELEPWRAEWQKRMSAFHQYD